MDGNAQLLILISAIALVPMLIISIVLMTGRGADLVAGYNTMTPEQKATWDKKVLCRFTGIMLLIYTLCLSAGIVCSLFGQWILFALFAGGGTFGLIGGVIYVNKSKRFRK